MCCCDMELGPIEPLRSFDEVYVIWEMAENAHLR